MSLPTAREREAVFLERAVPEPRWVVYRLDEADRLLSYFADETGTVTATGTFVYTREGPR